MEASVTDTWPDLLSILVARWVTGPLTGMVVRRVNRAAPDTRFSADVDSDMLVTVIAILEFIKWPTLLEELLLF